MSGASLGQLGDDREEPIPLAPDDDRWARLLHRGRHVHRAVGAVVGAVERARPAAEESAQDRDRFAEPLESFARTVLESILKEFPAERATIRVRKETPVIDGIVDAVGVEMSRSRAELGLA